MSISDAIKWSVPAKWIYRNLFFHTSPVYTLFGIVSVAMWIPFLIVGGVLDKYIGGDGNEAITIAIYFLVILVLLKTYPVAGYAILTSTIFALVQLWFLNLMREYEKLLHMSEKLKKP